MSDHDNTPWGQRPAPGAVGQRGASAPVVPGTPHFTEAPTSHIPAISAPIATEPNPSPTPSPAPPAPATPAGEVVALKGWPWMTAGMLCLVIGMMWTAQGLDLAEDSILSGTEILALAGPAAAVAGLALMVTGVRVRTRYKQSLLAAESSTS